MANGRGPEMDKGGCYDSGAGLRGSLEGAARDAGGTVVDDPLRAAFRAALSASIAPMSPPFTSESRRAGILRAAEDATIRLVHDLKRLGLAADAFPFDEARRYVEDLLLGRQAIPAVSRLGANAAYASLLSVLPQTGSPST